MFINLLNIKTYFICPSHNEKYIERQKHMELLLKKLGFTNFIHYKSGTENYPTCLSNATINILNYNLNDEPILLLEDDIEYTGEELSFNIPDNSDAIYIGISKCAGDYFNNIDNGKSICKSLNDTQVKIINMLSTHAILYISKKYKENVIFELNKYINTNYYNDVIISRIQQYYNIIANKHPIFYQSSKFGNVQHVEDMTKFIINNKYLIN